MLTPLLLLVLTAPATAGRDLVQIGNDEVRHGVHGLALTLDGDEAAALRRLDLPLDPARHRVYPVLLGARGEVLHDGRRPAGVEADANRATTTPALPADDASHTFFVPYHRLDLPPGEHAVAVELHLDPGPGHGPLRVLGPRPATVRMPPLDWAFVAVEQPPGGRGDPEIRWRVRVGEDVLAERSRTPAVVVLGERDRITQDVWDPRRERYVPLDRRSLSAAARSADLPSRSVRALEVRKDPPALARGTARMQAATESGQPGWRVDLRWDLEGRSVDALMHVDPVLYLADDEGTRWPLPTRMLVRGPDRARAFVPSWGLPAFVQAGRPWRLGWTLVARAGHGLPLTRDLALGREEVTLSPDGPLRIAPLAARLTTADIVEDDGLVVRTEVRWDLPPGLVAAEGLQPPVVRVGWDEGPGAPVAGPWTPCLPDAPACAEAWTLGPATDRHGATRVDLPLAWLAADPASPRVAVHADLDGYRGASTHLPLAVDLPTRRTLRVTPRKARVACAEGELARLVVHARGVELAATAPRPCVDDLRWSAADALEVPAFDGDRLSVGLEVDGRMRRRVPVRVVPGRPTVELAEPTAGIDRVKLRAEVE